MIEDNVGTSVINEKNKHNENNHLIDTTEFPDSIKKILKSLVFKAIEEEINEDNLTKSAANTDRFIFSNVPNMENIYLNIKQSFYFSRIVFFLSAFNLLNFAILTMYMLILSKPKNNSYCFNQHSNNFEICDLVQKCDETDTGISQVLYLEEYNGIQIYQTKELDELHLIQKLFQKYFYFDLLLVKSLNNEKANYAKSSFIFPYNVIITVKHNDSYNLRTLFNIKCDYYSSEMQIALFLGVALIFGNIVYGFFADLFGRKRILELIMFIEFFGCLLICIFVFFVIQSGNSKNINYPIPPFFDRTIDLTEYKDKIKPPSFTTSDKEMNDNYLNNFYLINQIIYDSEIIYSNFTKFKFILLFLSFLTFTGVGSGFCVSLSLMYEECIHEKDIYSNYCVYFLSVLLSHPFGFMILYLFNSLWTSFLVVSLFMLVLFFCSVVWLYESPRYHFEYCEYDKMTYILMKTCDKRYIKPLFREVHSESVEDEVEKMEKNYFETFSADNFKFLGKIKYLSQNEENDDILEDNSDVSNEDDLVFSRISFFFNIVSFFGLIMKNKKISQNFSVLFSLVCTSSLLYYITIGNANLIFNNLRETSIHQKISFYVFSILSNFFFYTMIKFFGYKLNFFIGYTGTLLTSFLFSIIIHKSNSFNDMNIYYYASFNITMDKVGTALSWIISIEYFFTHGLYFTLFLYLVKFSKTVYRCSFFCLAYLIIGIIMLIILCVCTISPFNMIYAILASFMGFIVTCFIRTDLEDNFVVEYRKVANKKKK